MDCLLRKANAFAVSVKRECQRSLSERDMRHKVGTNFGRDTCSERERGTTSNDDENLLPTSIVLHAARKVSRCTPTRK